MGQLLNWLNRISHIIRFNCVFANWIHTFVLPNNYIWFICTYRSCHMVFRKTSKVRVPKQLHISLNINIDGVNFSDFVVSNCGHEGQRSNFLKWHVRSSFWVGLRYIRKWDLITADENEWVLKWAQCQKTKEDSLRGKWQPIIKHKWNNHWNKTWQRRDQLVISGFLTRSSMEGHMKCNFLPFL